MRKNKYNDSLRRKIEALHEADLARLSCGIPEESPAETTKPKTQESWLQDMAEELKAMGLPYTEQQIYNLLKESVVWAANHPNTDRDIILPRRCKMIAPKRNIVEKRRNSWIRHID